MTPERQDGHSRPVPPQPEVELCQSPGGYSLILLELCDERREARSTQGTSAELKSRVKTLVLSILAI